MNALRASLNKATAPLAGGATAIANRTAALASQVAHIAQNSWMRLTVRDRRILSLALPLILLLLIYMAAVQPIMRHHAAMRTAHTELADTLEWLYRNSARVERLRNQCPRGRQPPEADLAEFAKRLALGTGTSPQIEPISPATLKITATGPGRALLGLLQTYSCHGFMLEELQINRQPSTAGTAVTVQMQVQLRAANFLRNTS
ncbi:MAG: type II secretion system protein M [Cellvibrionales bacterium]|nr:type II secretion system protein M [Cellvibrionales bacterium]